MKNSAKMTTVYNNISNCVIRKKMLGFVRNPRFIIRGGVLEEVLESRGRPLGHVFKYLGLALA